MATRKNRKKAATEAAPEHRAVAFQVRFDADLHTQLKNAADAASISLNQLIQGICRGAVAHLVQGEPDVSLSGYVRVKPQQGCVFFGRAGMYPSQDEAEKHYHLTGEEPAPIDNGTVWFALDFTNRGFVRFQPSRTS